MNTKHLFIVLTSTLLFSCGNAISNDELKRLNGYWEIETAVMPDGTKKEYTINPTIDYFEINGTKGFRKKVMPQFDGKYLINDQSESFTITTQDDKTYINYTTQYAKWKEEILELNDEKLVVKNTHDMEYHYSKPKPFSVK